MRAFLILEDGTAFEGRAIGLDREVISEIVFNTSMSGYQEILSDPSYAGQTLVMTYPLIGNYGVCEADMQSERVFADGFVVRDLSRLASNWRAENTLQNFLRSGALAGIAGVDTRALTKRLRERGTMNGCITTKRYAGTALRALLERIKAYKVCGAVAKTSVRAVRHYPAAADRGAGKKVALLDVGAKREIVRCLQEQGCEVTVYPSATPAETILRAQPDGIMISNGPGDPRDNAALVAEIRKLAESDRPIFAICLGHQLMALAMGGETFKLKFGHRGANHPVKELLTGRVYITSQNHGYAVVEGSLPGRIAEPIFRSQNDGTNEGLRYKGKNILTVQFHPEAGPGPQEAGYLFGEFRRMMERSFPRGTRSRAAVGGGGAGRGDGRRAETGPARAVTADAEQGLGL